MKDQLNLSDPIYLDYNATTPIDPQVADAMEPFLRQKFGNPSSGHVYGVKTKIAVNKARKQLAELINCEPENLIFTSGGTESNNYAIRGFAFANRARGNHIITSVVEHPAVINVCKYLEVHGFQVTYLPVDRFGTVDTDHVLEAVKEETILISIMHANNEVGTIQRIKQIAETAHKNEIILHCDAAQSLGKIAVDINELGVDLLSIAGHKLYAPKGVGALYVKPGIELEKFMIGGNQENDKRAGTENVLEIVGLGKAAEIAKENLQQEMKKNTELRDLLQAELQKAFPDAKLNGHPTQRLPNTLNISFKDVDEFAILEIFSEVAASAGAACHSDTVSISPVLEAMQVSLEYARGTIRFSVGRFTKKSDILTTLKIVKGILKK
ncbi:MAG: cysteine desulfurase [Candidatus Cloacimonetes bacterium]|nr:cysteine desulfurase [Candidatus Cloacimonadota bacterium]MCF7814025.1 cysteine desulfurase [Candidatus Cloacimonadota bacterium]MCF7868071.1 cysteine desulfurase [Candidatus Cloacimonadota bacterium]MCF7883494.1 cysteine desulfurase [Candidatus Cloacimonadota bacterium]